VAVGGCVIAVVISSDAHVLFRSLWMRCSLDVLPEWKRPVVDCPVVDCPAVILVSVFYVVEYFFDGEFWLPKLCRRTSVYVWRVLGVTGHELRSVLAMFCGLAGCWDAHGLVECVNCCVRQYFSHFCD
jgi:hypothetical protein